MGRLNIYCFKLSTSIEWPTSKVLSEPEPESEVVPLDINIGHYRGIYILNRDCNETFGKLFVPFVKLSIILMFIVCFFAFARVYKYLDLISLAFVGTAALTTAIILVPISLTMSSLYETSRQFSRNLSARIDMDSDSDNRLRGILGFQLRSCQLIRCQVGSLYYMEAKAKLTLLHYVVNGVMFLMVNVNI